MTEIEPSQNQISISGVLSARDSVRFTPAGIPITRATLQHQSAQSEAGFTVQVQFELLLDGAAQVSDQLQKLSLGQTVQCQGFLIPQRKGSQKLMLRLQHIAPTTQQ